MQIVCYSLQSVKNLEDPQLLLDIWPSHLYILAKMLRQMSGVISEIMY